MSTYDEIVATVALLAPDEVQRELAFAKAALDVNHPETVYWLAALYLRLDGSVLMFERGHAKEDR